MLEDFEQELALRMFASLRRFRAERLELERFIVMTLRRHVINLIREQQARWRIRFQPLPASESAGDIDEADGRSTPLTHHFVGRDPFDRMERQLDFQELLARLDPTLRSFAELLMTMPIESARKQLGISRRQAMRPACSAACDLRIGAVNNRRFIHAQSSRHANTRCMPGQRACVVRALPRIATRDKLVAESASDRGTSQVFVRLILGCDDGR